MAKQLETIVLIASLEKAAKTTGKALWSGLANQMDESRRNRVFVNLEKISKMAAQNKGKTILVPGKILSKGELTEKVQIVAVSASKGAKEKIAAKGEFTLLKDFANKCEKVKVSDIIIVK